MNYNIYFVKTAKCATETIRKYLIQYAKNNGLVINDKKFEHFYRNSSFEVVTNHIWNNEKSRKHFKESKSKNLPTIHLTSIREPLKRLYSHYCYGHPYFEQGIDFNEWYMNVNSGELEDYWPASQWGDRTNNYISHYMNVSSVEEFDEFYDFVFVKKYFDKSLKQFEELIGFEFDKLDEKVNVNSKVNRDYEFSDGVIDLFTEKNQLDIKLYKHSLKMIGE